MFLLSSVHVVKDHMLLIEYDFEDSIFYISKPQQTLARRTASALQITTALQIWGVHNFHFQGVIPNHSALQKYSQLSYLTSI